tara:strand:+ start:355 stop:573 length:219 start_codon:yes stop_codon:yes gene_type:complete
MTEEKCWECGAAMQQKTKPYQAEAKLDGILHRFHVPDLPYWACNNCGEEGYDDATNDAITDSLESHIREEED